MTARMDQDVSRGLTLAIAASGKTRHYRPGDLVTIGGLTLTAKQYVAASLESFQGHERELARQFIG